MTAEQRLRLIAAFRAWGEKEGGTVEAVCQRIGRMLEAGQDREAAGLIEQFKAAMGSPKAELTRLTG